MLFTITTEEDQSVKDVGMVPINRTWEFEAETLNEVLQGMADVLRGNGFTYVNELIATKEGGGETSSEDVATSAEIQLNIEDFLKDISKLDLSSTLETKHGRQVKKKPSHLRVIENGQEETES